MSVSLSMPECKCPFTLDKDIRFLRTRIGTSGFSFAVFKQDIVACIG